MLDPRYISVALIIVTFMLVTVGHVATYAGSFEAAGSRWLGLPYAAAVDLAIVVCAWLTRWETTRRTAFVGYITFAIMSGAMNFAAVKPWTHPWPEYVFVSIYALFPTCAIVLLGVLARDTEKAAERGKPRGILAKFSKRIASNFASAQLPTQSEQVVQTIDPSPQVPAFLYSKDHVRWLHEHEPQLSVTELAERVGCSLSTASRAISGNGHSQETVSVTESVTKRR